MTDAVSAENISKFNNKNKTIPLNHLDIDGLIQINELSDANLHMVRLNSI